MGQGEILTTVVGSYPAPSWFLAFPNRFHLRDAIMGHFESAGTGRHRCCQRWRIDEV
ncbi:hypothetical protein B0813_002077 [Candidatus Fervidibacteria bacterium JGI MDM2 SSWTFF-3-K9]